jgi:hypothetical protein
MICRYEPALAGNPQEEKNKMKRTMTILSILLLTSTALIACGPNQAATEEAAPPDTEEPAPEPSATPMPEPTATPDTGYDTYSAWAGEWSGSWTNTTFGSTGDLKATIAFNEDGTGSFTFDAGGFIFGALDPPEVTFNATFDAEGITVDLPGDEIFGDVTVTVHPDGTFEMVGDLIPTQGIARVEATGTFSAETIEATYTVIFDGSGVAEGTVMMTRSS